MVAGEHFKFVKSLAALRFLAGSPVNVRLHRRNPWRAIESAPALQIEQCTGVLAFLGVRIGNYVRAREIRFHLKNGIELLDSGVVAAGEVQKSAAVRGNNQR